MMKRIYLTILGLFFTLEATWAMEYPVDAVALNQVAYSNFTSQIEKVAHYAIQSRIEKHGSIEGAVQNESWDWGEGVLMFGLVNAYDKTGDRAILDFVKQWVEHHGNKGVNLSRTDHIAPAAVVSELMIHDSLDRQSDLYNSLLNQSYEFLMNEQIKLKGCKDETGKRKRIQLQWRGRSWLDDLFMTIPFMIRYSELSNNPNLQETITKHFLAHRDYLQCHKKNSQLLKHGNYLFKDYKLLFWVPSGNVAWARGNGWYVAALADFLDHIPEDSESFSKLIYLFQNLMGEIAAYQLQTGLFPTVLDDSSSYGEVSATALFVYATSIGIQNKWLEGERYYRLIDNGVKGILNNVSDNGRVDGTSAGTGVYPFAFFYKFLRPRGTYPWGAGSVLMALVEVTNLVETMQQDLME